MLSGVLRVRAEERQSLAITAGFARKLWGGAVSLNHRFDKLGNPLPLELYGCGCGLCAKQQRQLRQFWEAR